MPPTRTPLHPVHQKKATRSLVKGRRRGNASDASSTSPALSSVTNPHAVPANTAEKPRLVRPTAAAPAASVPPRAAARASRAATTATTATSASARTRLLRLAMHEASTAATLLMLARGEGDGETVSEPTGSRGKEGVQHDSTGAHRHPQTQPQKKQQQQRGDSNKSKTADTTSKSTTGDAGPHPCSPETAQAVTWTSYDHLWARLLPHCTHTPCIAESTNGAPHAESDTAGCLHAHEALPPPLSLAESMSSLNRDLRCYFLQGPRHPAVVHSGDGSAPSPRETPYVENSSVMTPSELRWAARYTQMAASACPLCVMDYV